MQLKEVVIDGSVSVAVEVDEDGEFSAQFLGDSYKADSLLRLLRVLRDAVRAARFTVPFVSLAGRPGVMRGYHAANRDLLVTWNDGDKGRLATHERVFRPGAVGQDELDEITALERVIVQARERVQEIQARGERASDLFNEAFGEDITDPRRTRVEA